jgi:uncharacterized integral membrane protein (TIGR00698 family)
MPVVGKKFLSRENLPGILLASSLAVPAWLLGRKLNIVGGPVFGILFGILLNSFISSGSFGAGTKATSKKLLQAAIVLLGFEMNMRTVMRVGEQSLLIMLFTLSAAFITAYFFSKALRIESRVATLVGVGTAICGGSAIAATAPVVNAEMDEVATSISTIFLFNVMAVFIFPALGHLMGMSDVGFGLWAGTAINDTSSVVAAGCSYSQAAGQFATIVKLTRTLAIIPITFVLALYTTKKNKAESQRFRVIDVFPWFVLGFLAACVVNSVGLMPAALSAFLGKSGKFFIVVAMVAIGLNTNIRSLLSNSKKSIALGAVCWFAVAVTSLIVQYLLGLI